MSEGYQWRPLDAGSVGSAANVQSWWRTSHSLIFRTSITVHAAQFALAQDVTVPFPQKMPDLEPPRLEQHIAISRQHSQEAKNRVLQDGLILRLPIDTVPFSCNE